MPILDQDQIAKPLGNFTATAAPTATDDSADGYSPGSEWIDITNDEQYVCLDATAGSAVWENVTTGGSGSTNLALGTVNTTTVQVTSDTGTDVTLPAATTSAAGVMPSADKTKVDFVSVTQAVDLDEVEAESGNLVTLSGVASDSTSLGTFTGATITDNVTIKAALQELETAVEAVPGQVQYVVADITARDALTPNNADIAYVVDASADATVASGAAMYIRSSGAWAKIGEFESLDVATDLATGTINATTVEITSSTGNNVTVPAATATDAGVMPAADKVKTDHLTVTQAVNLDELEAESANLVTLSGVASDATDLGTFTGTTIADNVTNKAALQTLETALEAQAISFADNETPGGAVNGTNTAFTLANTPTAGSVHVYRNGVLQALTTDYTIAGTTITFVSAPLTGNIIRASYRY